MRTFLEIISPERFEDTLNRHRDVVLSFYRGRIYSTEAVFPKYRASALGYFRQTIT